MNSNLGKLAIFLGLYFGVAGVGATHPVQIVTEFPDAKCQHFDDLRTPVRLYYNTSYDDLSYSTFTGSVDLAFVGPDRPIEVVGILRRVVDPSTPRFDPSASVWKNSYAMARPAQICGQGYNGAFGYILVSEWEAARRAPVAAGEEESMPPSTKNNPIPIRREAKTQVTTPLF